MRTENGYGYVKPSLQEMQFTGFVNDQLYINGVNSNVSDFQYSSPIQNGSNQSGVGFTNIVELGLGITGTGSDIALYVTDFERFKGALASGRIPIFKNGKIVSIMSEVELFKELGNLDFVRSAANGALTKYNAMTGLKFVSNLSKGATGLGLAFSLYKTSTGEQTGEKLALDFIMARIAFVPGYGWVVGGIYTILDLGGAFDFIAKPMPKNSQDCIDENVNEKDNLGGIGSKY